MVVKTLYHWLHSIRFSVLHNLVGNQARLADTFSISSLAASIFMQALAAFVNRSFRRVEHAAESLIGKAGPLFVAIYVALVGTGMWIFCKSPHTLS